MMKVGTQLPQIFYEGGMTSELEYLEHGTVNRVKWTKTDQQDKSATYNWNFNKKNKAGKHGSLENHGNHKPAWTD